MTASTGKPRRALCWAQMAQNGGDDAPMPRRRKPGPVASTTDPPGCKWMIWRTGHGPLTSLRACHTVAQPHPSAPMSATRPRYLLVWHDPRKPDDCDVPMHKVPGQVSTWSNRQSKWDDAVQWRELEEIQGPQQEAEQQAGAWPPRAHGRT
ncbi:hypothetical protein JB92DRAFT_3107668 [Gautieria morchelliformis]|nr:hypothetical protein JB92DRAFT_3107668 [Gautieria morchelliformis]